MRVKRESAKPKFRMLRNKDLFHFKRSALLIIRNFRQRHCKVLLTKSQTQNNYNFLEDRVVNEPFSEQRSEEWTSHLNVCEDKKLNYHEIVIPYNVLTISDAPLGRLISSHSSCYQRRLTHPTVYISPSRSFVDKNAIFLYTVDVADQTLFACTLQYGSSRVECD